MEPKRGLLEQVRDASVRAVVTAGVIGLLAFNGLIGAAAYGYAVASAIADLEDDTDDDRP